MDTNNANSGSKPADLNSSNDTSELLPIPATSPMSVFAVNQCFTDLRPFSLVTVQLNVREHAKSNGQKARVPKFVIVRVLEVTPEGVRTIVWNDPTANDQLIPAHEALGYVNSGEWKTLDSEPSTTARISDAQLSAKSRKRRDADFNLISPIVDLGAGMFDPKLRGEAVRKICEASEKAPTQVYRVFRRYLQGGMTANSLVGRWFRRRYKVGLGSAILSLAEVRAGKTPALVGPRRKDEAACIGGDPFPRSRRVHAGDVHKMVQGMREFGDTERGRGNVHRAWLLTVAQYYLPELIGLQPNQIEEALNDSERATRYSWYPSERMFRYWIMTDTSIRQKLIRREGLKNFNLKYRPLSSHTEKGTWGPGCDFQIDATKLDLIAVHEDTRRPIGRGTANLVIDCSTLLIAGYYFHVGHESYNSASLAILAAARDKVELCREFGIEITEEQWPSACLPQRLRADSGLNSLKAHSLVTGKYVLAGEGLLDLTILPSYRADLKGAIESSFAAVTKSTINHLPGYSTGQRRRATKNPLATASLSVREINRILIYWILQYNRRQLKGHTRTTEMIKDGVELTPLSLWQWGVANLTGARRRWPQDLLKSLCLPEGKAQMTRRGLKFGDLVYEPFNKEELPDFDSDKIRVASTGGWSERVTFHPNSVAELWMHLESGETVRMKLADPEEARKAWTWYDYDSDVFEQAAAAASAAVDKIATVAVLEAKKNVEAECGEKVTTDARGTYAQRRLEKVDTVAAAAAQRDLTSGRSKVPEMPNMEPDSPGRDAGNPELAKLLGMNAKRFDGGAK